MKRSSLVGLTGTAVVLMLATGVAIGGEARMGQKEAETAAGISIEQAITAATQKYPGKVLEAELEDEDGPAVWELDILTSDGQKIEVQVDGRTGEVLAPRRPRTARIVSRSGTKSGNRSGRETTSPDIVSFEEPSRMCEPGSLPLSVSSGGLDMDTLLHPMLVHFPICVIHHERAVRRAWGLAQT